MNYPFGFIAADTSRSRAYLSEMERQDILPALIILLQSSEDNLKPGQAPMKSKHSFDSDWLEANFDPCEPLEPWFRRLSIQYMVSPSNDINDELNIEILSNSGLDLFIYSGFGSVILKSKLLNIGISFLHIHGGYLPNYKGSTTNYFDILDNDCIGASAILLTEKIDSGPLLYRSKFKPPKEKVYLDHIYDSAARARVLSHVMSKYVNSGQLPDPIQTTKEKYNYYYIIHPVLKHISIIK